MTTLITGGCGFLGNYLAKELVNRQEKVIAFDLVKNFLPYLENEVKEKIEYVNGDLRSWQDIFDTVVKYRVEKIFHTGAFLSHKAEEYPLKAFEINLLGTWYVLEAARILNLKQVIFVSTVASFGDYIGEPVNNTDPQYPHTMYGVTKVSSERLGEYYKRKYNVDFRGVRLPSVIGPGRGPGGASAYSSLIIEDPAKGEAYDVHVKPSSRMPMLYVKDATKCLLQLSEAREDFLNYRMYNIQGFSPSAEEMVEEIKKALPEAQINFNPNEPIVNIVDSWPDQLDDTEAKKDWGWMPDFELKCTVKDFISEVQALQS